MTIQHFDHHLPHMTCQWDSEKEILSYTYAPEYGEPHTSHSEGMDQSEINWLVCRGYLIPTEAQADHTNMVSVEDVVTTQTDNEVLRSEIREVEQFVQSTKLDDSDWHQEHDYILDNLSQLPCFSDRAVKIYLDYVRPLYVHQDYMNNFLTVNGMAEYYDYPERVVKSLINQGKHVRDNILNG